MPKILSCCVVFFAGAIGVLGQTGTSRLPYVHATGTGSVSIKPDQATVDLSVVTQGATASAASTTNATQTTSVINALTTLLGVTASVKTVSYSLVPNYSYSGTQSTLIGYTATNTVEVTLTNLSQVGPVIDTGVQAGANQVVGLQFGLQNDAPARAQALQLAVQQAKAQADALANGLGLHTGGVQVIQQGAQATPVVYAGLASSVASTPIQPANLTIQVTVTLDMSLTQ